MIENVDKKSILIQLVFDNKLNELKTFVQENQIKLEEVNYDEYNPFDILIESIKNNCSLDIIKFIINEWYQNSDFNYTIRLKRRRRLIDRFNFNINNIISPLSLAIEKNNYDVADYLIEKGAKIDDFSDLMLLKIINKQNKNYILNKKIVLRESLTTSLINHEKFYFLEEAFKYYMYNIELIIKLLLLYKNSTPMTAKQLEDIINMNNGKIQINKSAYQECYKKYFGHINDHNNQLEFYKKFYNLLQILYFNDSRSKNSKQSDLKETLNNFNIEQKSEFINIIKSQENYKYYTQFSSLILNILEESK